MLLCQESAPVLKMLLTPDNSGLFVATTNSAIKCWVRFFINLFVFIDIVVLVGQKYIDEGLKNNHASSR